MSNAKVRHRRRRRAQHAQPQPESRYARKFTDEERAEAVALIAELPRIPVSQPHLQGALRAALMIAALASVGVREY